MRQCGGKYVTFVPTTEPHWIFMEIIKCLDYNNWKELGSNGTSSRALLYSQLQKEPAKVEETQPCKMYDVALSSYSPNISTYIFSHVVSIQYKKITTSNKRLFLWPSKQWKPGQVEILLFTGTDFMQSVTVLKSIYSSGTDKTTINALWIYTSIHMQIYYMSM